MIAEISPQDERRVRLLEKLSRELGATITAALADPAVVEVMLNADGAVWIDKLGSGMRESDIRMTPAQAENALRTIASALETSINADQPILEGILPGDGSRIVGILPPITAAPVFAIRKRAAALYTLDDYATQGIASPQIVAALREAVAARKNILIVGSTGSGKTTLANALLHEIAASAPEQRVVILEDTVELQCGVPNHVALRTHPAADMTRLLRTTMRLRPDRIVVGELRGAEALTLLKAWNTGHPGGVTTIHANSARAGLVRLESLVQEALVPPQPQLIATAIDVIVTIVRTEYGRRIDELVYRDGVQSLSA